MKWLKKKVCELFGHKIVCQVRVHEGLGTHYYHSHDYCERCGEKWVPFYMGD
jgi:hypothetical protein